MAIEMSSPSPASRPARRRRRRPGAETRAEIIAAAERHFAESGYEATRLEDVASDVGIRRAAIFYHFGDKQELYHAVLDQALEDWARGLPAEGEATERLVAGIESWIDYIAGRPTVARLILREAANVRMGVESPFLHAGREHIAWFAVVIQEGVASGELKPVMEPLRFLSLMAAITVFHFFAAMPWLTQEQAVDPASREEFDRHKREVLQLARGMLGIDSPAQMVAG